MTGVNNKQSNANGHQDMSPNRKTHKNDYLTPKNRIILNNAILETNLEKLVTKSSSESCCTWSLDDM